MHVMGSVSPANESEGFSFQEEDVAIAVAMPPSCPPRFSDILETESKLSDPPHPPPPPPPPLPTPPPPPPPGPPLASGQGNPAVGLKKLKQSSVRRFFWKKIPEEKVRGHANLWNQGQGQQHFQIDTQQIEELFGQNECQTDAMTAPSRADRKRASFRETKKVSILDSKRAMNIAIFLKRFKRSNQVIVDDIRHGNSESFGAEPLKQLLKLLPETEEVRKLNSCTDVSELQLADSFVYLLIQVPSYSLRIESMLLKEEFPGSCEVIKQNIKTLRSAIRELMCCSELHAVLHLVLQAGNILNDGGYAGNAVGYKLSSLLSLADTKANKPGINLLHFVALEAEKKDENLLKFPLKLSSIQAASRISLEMVDVELQSLKTRTESFERNIKTDTQLLQELDSFLQSVMSSLRSLEGSRKLLTKEGNELIDFLCEDSETFRLGDCFRIFNSFCTRFSSAVKENMEREAKEAARRQRIQEEDHKRHSWPGGEEVEGAFALRCSSETNVSQQDDAQSLLYSLLSSSPKPRTRSWNHTRQQRSQTSPSCAASIAAERDLSELLGMSIESKAAQRRGSGNAMIPFPSASPKLRFYSGLSSAKTTTLGHMDSQSLPVPPKTSSSQENTNHTTSTYLSNKDANIANKVMESNQQSGNSNIGNNLLDLNCSSQTTAQAEKTDTDRKAEHRTPVKSFNKVTNLTNNSEADCIGHLQQGSVISDLEEEVSDKSRKQKGESKSRETGNAEEAVAMRSSSQREENEEQEDVVVVWCVTRVCEASGESSQAQTDMHQHGGDNQAGYQQTSPFPANQPSELQLTNKRPEPAPISCQPVPVSRCNDSSLHVSSAPANQRKAAEVSTNEETDVLLVPEQSSNHKSENKTTLRTSTDGKAKRSASSKLTTKNFPTSKPGMKSLSPNIPTSVRRSKSVSTPTQSEIQNMKRVVPIRTSRGTTSTTKHPEKSAASLRRSFRTPMATSLTPPNSSPSHKQERPATAHSSQRSGPNSKELRDQKALIIQGSARDQNQGLQRKLPNWKPVTKPKTQTEEKLCVSKLAALSQGGREGSVSAPVTPLHKAQTPSSTLRPHFAQNTASSSFRRTHSTLASSSAHNTGFPKSSTKDSSSVPLTVASATPTSAGSPIPKTRTPNPLNVRTSSPLKKPQSIRSSTLSPLHNSPAFLKDHHQYDSGSFSDRSAQSRESVKPTKPSWR